MKEIAIITGGDSAEYEISIQSANVVLKNLNPLKYNGTLVHIKESIWTAILDGVYYPINKQNFSFISEKNVKSFDYVFMALHGNPAENGKIQNYFDNLNIPYSSCNSEVSALTFNKIECNKQLSNLGFQCAKSLTIKHREIINQENIVKKLGLPLFVKPNQAGSSFGISKVKDKNEIQKAIKKAFLYDKIVLLEEFIEGTEISCGVIRKKI